MAASRQHHQTGARDGALHQQPRLERGVVLVARHDQGGRRDARHLRLQVVERGPARLVAEHGVGGAERRVLGQVADVPVEPARVLRSQLQARRIVAVGGGELRHALLQQYLGVRARGALELLPLRRHRTVAAAGDDEAQGARAVLHAEMQRGEAAHGKSHDVGAPDLQCVQHREDVVSRALLRVALHALGHVRGRVAARVVGDAAVAARKVGELRIPAAQVPGELVHEHDRRASARLLVVQFHAVVGGDVGHVGRLTEDGSEA